MIALRLRSRVRGPAPSRCTCEGDDGRQARTAPPLHSAQRPSGPRHVIPWRDTSGSIHSVPALHCAALALAAGARRAETRCTCGSGRSPPERPARSAGNARATAQPAPMRGDLLSCRGTLPRHHTGARAARASCPARTCCIHQPDAERQGEGGLKSHPNGPPAPQSAGGRPILWGCSAPFRKGAICRGRCRRKAGVGGALRVVPQTQIKSSNSGHGIG